MGILDKYMPLTNNETILASLEGNAYTQSHNIIMKLVAFFVRIISVILGMPRKVYIFATENRVITIETSKWLYFFDGSIRARSYTPRSISNIGYVFKREGIFKSHYLEFSSGSTNYLIKSKEGKEKVYEILEKLVNMAEKVTSK
jgi:hypothetical protein